MLLFLVLQVAFVLSNTVANCLPRSVIESHAQGSESSALLSDMYVYDHRVAAGPVCFDNNRFIIEVTQQRTKVLRLRRWLLPRLMTLRKPARLRISSTTGIGMDGSYLRMSACLLAVSMLSWCPRLPGDCRLRLRLRCLAEAVFNVSDVGFPCNPVVLDQSVFNYIGDTAVHLVLCGAHHDVLHEPSFEFCIE